MLAPLTGCSEFTFGANKVSGNDVESVTLDVTYMKLEEGQTLQLVPTIKYKNDKEIKVYQKWMTSNDKVADVSQDGLVTALSGGRATITLLVGLTGSASCVIEVPKNDTPVPTPTPSGFTLYLNETSKELHFHDTFQLIATTSEEAEVTWEVTEGGSIVTVDEAGLVTAGAVEGTAIVTAKAKDAKATCTFTVKEEEGSGEEEDLKTVKFFFFIDYNNVDETDETGTKLLASFKWYPNKPVGQSGLVPATPANAPTSDFPYFIGWSTHPVIDDKNLLMDVNTFEAGDTRNFLYVFGIWSDVPADQF